MDCVRVCVCERDRDAVKGCGLSCSSSLMLAVLILGAMGVLGNHHFFLIRTFSVLIKPKYTG